MATLFRNVFAREAAQREEKKREKKYSLKNIYKRKNEMKRSEIEFHYEKFQTMA